MSAKGDPVARGRPFAEQTEGPAGGLQSASDKHAHTEKDYCQLGYSHKAISVFQKLELSLKGKNGRKESMQYTKKQEANSVRDCFLCQKIVNNEITVLAFQMNLRNFPFYPATSNHLSYCSPLLC